jgi:endo-alpha-1,4-polygalactosaminidase (GH114 family)
MAYPEKWNAIHRLVVITEQLVDESVDGVFPDWVDQYNPWSKTRRFVEDFLKNNLKVAYDEVKGFRATVTSVNSRIFILIEKCEGYNNSLEPNEVNFKYEIKYNTTDGKKHTEFGQGLMKCTENVRNIKLVLDKTNGRGIIKYVIDTPDKRI